MMILSQYWFVLFFLESTSFSIILPHLSNKMMRYEKQTKKNVKLEKDAAGLQFITYFVWHPMKMKNLRLDFEFLIQSENHMDNVFFFLLIFHSEIGFIVIDKLKGIKKETNKKYVVFNNDRWDFFSFTFNKKKTKAKGICWSSLIVN